MSNSDPITVKSALREYRAEFVEDFTVPFKYEIDSGGVLVIDSVVLNIYKDRIENVLEGKESIVIEANEGNKTLNKCREIIERLVKKGIRRNQKLIAVGGGVVQDVVAFTASITYRGLEWIFFPTTLLAQADSCIGSKTSLNLGGTKNLIGNFYPPSRIYLDPHFLDSLSVTEIKSGIGEMMHFYLYAGSPYFDKLIQNYEKVIKNRQLLSDYIRESLAIKKPVVEMDEFDKGERNKFNYGHTFGHALENTTNYEVNHGQAVTVGMDLANHLSLKMGMMDERVFNELHRRLLINFPDYRLDNINLERYLEALSKDKKNLGTTIGCILAEAPARLVKKQVPADQNFKNYLREYFSAFHKRE